METFLSGIDYIARIDVLIALLIGSVGGVMIGSIPGVGPAVAIAILLPATFAFDPIVGLTLLLGIYGSSMYGGAIPAILINTPGTAANALTTYDGYPMTQRGEPHRALSLAYWASFVGGIFSVVCLILLTPVLAAVAPMFGSREIFLAALLGIVLVIVTHRGQALAAGFLVCFGIFINTIGLEPIRYTQRYTFEQSWLSSGVNLIVVVLGLFAISQAYTLLIARDESPEMPKLRGSMFSGLKEVVQHKRVALFASGSGVSMGIIPGVGEFLAQFMSYTYASNTSKHPEKFGHGAPEGLIASESANNAVPGAAMIPLLALGIPGEALTAMMLSVFYVHNVVPGPQLFQEQPDFIVGLYLVLLLLNIIVVAFLIFATKGILQVIRIPTRFLGVVVLTLSFVGVYSLRNSATDCALAAGFGVLGYILKRLNLPVVPIILGMVLGGIMET
ncbi:MAG: tripartite tricarboxylate transporter permease, partial [Pseudorhodobacter sp.]